MTSAISGIVFNVSISTESTLMQFCIQDDYGKNIVCRYKPATSFPLMVNDRVQCIGEFESQDIAGTIYNLFMCNFVTARYDFDLLAFLMKYMPYVSKKTKSDEHTLTQYFHNVTDKIYEYCRENIGGISPDDICKLFSSLYNCMSSGDETYLSEFSSVIFGSENIKPLKHFLKMWNNDVLIRPLQLMGLTEKEISAIHVPLHVAYNILKTNPFRLPQYSIEKANTIAKMHLRLGFKPHNEITNHKILTGMSIDVNFCGEICRLVYNNLHQRKWTSTPVSKIKEKFPMYDDLKIHLEQNYFCVEEMDNIYFKPLYYMEKNVAKKISELIQKPDRDLRDAVFPGRLPSEMQQSAVNMMLRKGISKLIGGPGTGKTTTLTELIRNVNMNGEKIICTAFMGAATTRMRVTTKKAEVYNMCEIMTLHMMIALQQYIRDSKFKYVVIDEFSMIDLSLFAEFISVFRDLDYQLVLIGDINQLEPIGYGNVMQQFNNIPIPTVQLTENFRSSTTIVNICNEIIDKDRIRTFRNVNWYQAGEDYRFMIGNMTLLEQLIAYYAHNFIANPDKSLEENLIDFAEYRDKFTIICPFKKIVEQINPIFQKYFMSHVKEFTYISNIKFYLGDRIMKLVNDYGIKVMNGERGKVVAIHKNYIVCEFRNEPDTRTPYIDRNMYTKMKQFVKDNGIKVDIFDKDENGTIKSDEKGIPIKKSIDQIRVDVQLLKNKYIMPNQVVPVYHDNETKVERDQREYIESIYLYFHLLEIYPFAMTTLDSDAEFSNIKNISLAYAVTTHKSQGDEFQYVIYFNPVNSNSRRGNTFVTINNLYTGMSRAQVHLDVITEDLDSINAASFNRSRYVYDNLAQRTKTLLPIDYLKDDQKNDDEIIQVEDDDDFDDADYFGDFGMVYDDNIE